MSAPCPLSPFPQDSSVPLSESCPVRRQNYQRFEAHMNGQRPRYKPATVVFAHNDL